MLISYFLNEWMKFILQKFVIVNESWFVVSKVNAQFKEEPTNMLWKPFSTLLNVFNTFLKIWTRVKLLRYLTYFP